MPTTCTPYNHALCFNALSRRLERYVYILAPDPPPGTGKVRVAIGCG